MKHVANRMTPWGLATAIAFALSAPPALAQHAGHGQHATPEPTQAPEDPHAGHAMPAPPAAPRQADPQQVDHAAMGHGSGHGMDHGSMGHAMPMPAGQREAMSLDLAPDAAPHEPIPPITAADRAAAFSGLVGHDVHDDNIHYFAILDRLETWDADDGTALAWEGSGWVGTDLDRLWLRSEGEHVDGELETANVEVFYGRAIARWWDAVIGIRHDFGVDPSQTFAAFGVMGLAPYKFEVQATAYVGQSGQTGLGVEAEYETRFTNRLILQSRVEAEAWGRDDAPRGIASGLGTAEAGLRLRYEFTRQFAPYLGVAWERALGGTADLRRAEGHDLEDTRFVVGLRTWF